MLADLVRARRPHRADAARNFDALLSAAREAFTRAGVNVPLEEIASEAGVGIATLYRNFPRREDLVESVYLVEVDAVCASAGELAGRAPWDALVAWIERFVTYLNTKRALVEMLNRRSASFRTCRDALYETATPLLARAVDAGEADPGVDTDDLMRLVFALTGGVYRDADQRTRILHTALRGLCATAATPPRRGVTSPATRSPKRRRDAVPADDRRPRADGRAT